MTTERGPQPEDHAAGLEEAHLVVRLLGLAPAHRLIKRPSSPQIRHAQSDKTDSLFHEISFPRPYDNPTWGNETRHPASGLRSYRRLIRPPLAGAGGTRPGDDIEEDAMDPERARRLLESERAEVQRLLAE